MNFWDHLPTRDEALDKIYEFLQLLSQNRPIEAETLVNVGSFQKFRDTVHYYITDYLLMLVEDSEVFNLPDDMSVAISDPHEMNEDGIYPVFSGNDFVTQPNERISVYLGYQNEATTVKVEFMIYVLDKKVFLNVMKVNKD